MTIDYLHRFLTSLGFTVALETLVLFLLLRFVVRNKTLDAKQIISAGVFASSLTIPYVWFVFPYVADWPRATSLLYSEPLVFLIEAVFYRLFLKVDMKTALFLSLVCNIASYLVGPFLRTHGIWIYW